MIRRLLKLVVRFVIWIAYSGYRAEGVNALLLLMPAKFIVPTLRQHGAEIGENVEIHSPLIIHNANSEQGKHYAHLHIADNCYFGRDILIDLKDEIHFDSRVTVSMRVTFITHTDVGKSPLAKKIPPSHAPIMLRCGAYIGAGATILQGVEIGENSIVGAGAVVIEDVPPGMTVVGVPAHEVKSNEN